jgi:hypothetical protein
MSIEQRHIDEGEQSPVLGPAYFAARELAANYMAHFEAEHFKPLVDKVVDEIRTKLWDDLEYRMLSDIESNLQSGMWRLVDDSVKALLGGKQWALQRYALGSRYECAEIRETVAKHIPAELQNERVADLEIENARLVEQIEFLRRMQS